MALFEGYGDFLVVYGWFENKIKKTLEKFSDFANFKV
jgi:hypothetical protein